MAIMKPFRGIRPVPELADQIAALPYDVYTREEAKAEVQKHTNSFLRIDRAETQFSDHVNTYDDCVYQKAHDLLSEMIAQGQFIQDQSPCYYIYELTMEGRTQTGLVGCASIDDYQKGIVKKHENTRADKEKDRIRHVDSCNAQTGPIFLTYRAQQQISDKIAELKQAVPVYDFVSDDNITHRVWCVADESEIAYLEAAFAGTDYFYIADGHHRAASAVKVGLKRREENPGYTGQEEFNYFLSVLFPDEELKILDYNRLVKDLNGFTVDEFLHNIPEAFDIKEKGSQAYRPESKNEIGMCIRGTWYCLAYKKHIDSDNPVHHLDVEILQKEILSPILGIQDPKTDERITFLGGIWGVEEVGKRTESEYAVGFTMYPTSMHELLSVADAGELMPPKSTWFEPKLRSGIFIHEL